MSFLSNADADQVMMCAIEKKNHIRITRRNDTDWQMYKSRLESGSFEHGIAVGEQYLTYGRGGAPSGEVGVSLRLGHHKLLFSTTLQNNSLTWPTKIAKLSRRAFERQQPRDSLTVRFWTAENQEQIYAQLEDISTGGMQISAVARDYKIGPYLCSIDHPKIPVHANAILRTVDLSENQKRVTLGFQFVGLEFDPQTTIKLTGLTRKLSRQKIRTRTAAPWSLSLLSD